MVRIRGRANTKDEKRNVIERLEKVWQAHPEMRLSQLILNAFKNDIYYSEDFDLIDQIEKFYQKV